MTWPRVMTCLRVQELKKLCFYLLWFQRSEGKTKDESSFSQSALFVFQKNSFENKTDRGHQKPSFETNYIDLWSFWGVLGVKIRSKKDWNWPKKLQKLLIWSFINTFWTFFEKYCWGILKSFIWNPSYWHMTLKLQFSSIPSLA